MSGPLKKYAFINAKLRARISKIIPEEIISQMIHAHSLSEAIQILRNTSFSVLETVYSSTGDLKMGESELFKMEVELYIELGHLLKNEQHIRDFVKALTMRYEIDNLKNILRLWFDLNLRKRSIDHASVYLYRKKIIFDLHIDDILAAKEIAVVIDLLKNTPYERIVQDRQKHVTAERSLFPVEIALDQYYYTRLIYAAEKLKGRDPAIIRRMIGVEIDMQNINWIIRLKDFYNFPLEKILSYTIPNGYAVDQDSITSAYESKGDVLSGLIKKKYPNFAPMLAVQREREGQTSDLKLILVERILEQIMLAEVRHTLSGYPFTIGIIPAYFILKRNEIKKIMTILNAKYYKLPEQRIKSVL